MEEEGKKGKKVRTGRSRVVHLCCRAALGVEGWQRALLCPQDRGLPSPLGLGGCPVPWVVAVRGLCSLRAVLLKPSQGCLELLLASRALYPRCGGFRLGPF